MDYVHASFLIGTPGPTELIILLLVVLLIFGAKRLPEIGASMGKGIREFKRSIRDVQDSIDESDEAPPARQLDAPAQTEERTGEPKKLSE